MQRRPGRRPPRGLREREPDAGRRLVRRRPGRRGRGRAAVRDRRARCRCDHRPTFPGILGVTAPCTPRRIVVTAILDARSTGLAVRLRDGRRVRARVVRLPAVAGRRRLAVAVLPAAVAPVRLVLRGGRSRAPLSRPFALPPAARQCGYIGVTGSLERPGPLR